ncbi:MAG: helix-turn-helix transcriptional regulator [Bacteroidales bacterium]|nr:helix-turn-helix transcriptional regulator [Bacteroidales bacterium]
MDKNVGTIIKERRAQLGISQQDLAEFSGVGIATVKDIERGVANPSLITLQKLLDVLGLEMIFRRKDSFNTNQN